MYYETIFNNQTETIPRQIKYSTYNSINNTHAAHRFIVYRYIVTHRKTAFYTNLTRHMPSSRRNHA